MRLCPTLLTSGIVMATLASGVRGADPAEKGGVEVLARGPVHEAYAEPVEGKPAAGPVVQKQPPAAIDELPPDQKPEGDNVVWLPGYWAWDDDRTDFIWISGFWRVPPPNRVWMPGSWRQAGNGWQWVAGFWSAAAEQQAEIQYLPEPPAPVEAGPATPAPADTSIYVPGCWVYRGDRYLWRPGFWIDHKPGWIWIPAHYRWTPAGYVFVDGYWDYPLEDRGMLFAPVYIPPTVYVAPSYCWTPTIVVREQCMYGALFVRRGWGCYYFGDYFGPTYASVGFTSWVGYSGGRDVVVVRGWYDPMYSYYRVSHRHDPYWRNGIHEQYVGRYRGDIPVPPRTLVQQNTVINNVTVNNTTVINNKTVNVNQVQMVSNINQQAATGGRKLTTISADARKEQVQAARQITTVAQQRSQAEAQIVSKHPGLPKGNEAPRSVKLDVPKPAAVRAQAVDNKPNLITPKNTAAGPNIAAPRAKEQPKVSNPVGLAAKKDQPVVVPQPIGGATNNPQPKLTAPSTALQPKQPNTPVQQPQPKLTAPATALQPKQPNSAVQQPQAIRNPSPALNPVAPPNSAAPLNLNRPLTQQSPLPALNPMAPPKSAAPLPMSNPQPALHPVVPPKSTFTPAAPNQALQPKLPHGGGQPVPKGGGPPAKSPPPKDKKDKKN